MKTNETETTMTVTKLDGTTESVQVKRLPPSLYPRYLECVDHEPKTIELLCDRPDGWADTLTLESFEALVIEGDRLNQEGFGRWLSRRMSRMERVMPGYQGRVGQLLGNLPGGSGDAASPPRPGSRG